MSTFWSSQMPKLITLITMALLLIACSVKLEKAPKIPVDIDSDGDFKSNQDELSVDRNPYLAEVPKLKVQFLQSYSISVRYRENGIIAPPLLIKNQQGGEGSLISGLSTIQHIVNEAARIGRFNSHHHGNFPQKMSWIRYPNVDQRSYLDDMERFNSIDSTAIEDITITLESTVRPEDGIYHSIKNLEVDFFYYDYKRAEYRHLGTEIVKHVFPAGVDKSFKVTLLNVPLELIQDNYFGRGEFIISNIKDFDIPDINMTYKELLSQVQQKTITVMYNTPLEHMVYYVAVGSNEKRSFDSIIEEIFDDQFSIDDEGLNKINQFESNIGSYNYLHELSDRPKNGKWFVFTGPINQHYLDYQFGHNDNLALVYITGDTLSKQRKETIYISKELVTNDASINQIELGEVEANSEIHLRLSPILRWGEFPKFKPIRGQDSAELICEVEEVSFESYQEPLLFEQTDEIELSQIFLIIDNNHYKISDLIQNNNVRIFQDDNGVHLHIKNILDVHDFTEEKTKTISLKTMAFSGTAPQGMFIKKMEYSNSSEMDTCVGWAMGSAIGSDIPISKSSQDFEEWEHKTKNVKLFNYIIELNQADDKIYYQNFSVDISAIIIRFYN